MYAENSRMGDRLIFQCCELWAATMPRQDDFTNIYMLAEIDVINIIHREFYEPTKKVGRRLPPPEHPPYPR